MTRTHVEPSDEGKRSGHDERCTAPHPLRAFALSLPAFAVVLAAALLLWQFA